MTMISPWILLALSLPLLFLGELLVRRVKWLSRFDLPASIVGGLLVAFGVLAWNLAATPAQPPTTVITTAPATGPAAEPTPALGWRTETNARWLTWLVMAEPQWNQWVEDKKTGQQVRPGVDVYIPFSTLFFTCVGLAASWRVVRTGGTALLIFLGLASILTVVQSVVGIWLAHGLGEHGVLGLLCGGVTLTGGMNTAIANDDLFRGAGFFRGKEVGAAATMFGIVISSLMAGAIGGAIIRHRRLADATAAEATIALDRPRRGFFDHVAALWREPFTRLLLHLLILFICIKIGAYLRLWIMDLEVIKKYEIKFPVYLPGLILAVVVRNVLDAINPAIVRSDVVERIAGVALGIFLVAAISSLNLMALQKLAGPMLTILSIQVVLMIGFAVLVTFVVMGRNYDAALIGTGHIGFGLGMTTNAVATMDTLMAKYGPSPRSLLIVTLVGGFLVDVVNSLVIPVMMKLV